MKETTHNLWHLPPSDLTWSSSEIHVWRAPLDEPDDRAGRLVDTLSHDEITRAKRFHFERDRRRFIVGRGVLRAIISRYTGVNASQLEFSYGQRGKPYLMDTCGKHALQFNMSHSDDLALYALTLNREVGVDLERIRSIPDMEQIARHFFSTRENIAFQAVPMHLKHQAFFTCWTRKEAYIKATGNGLSLPLDQFDVSLAPGEPARLVSSDILPEEASRWSLLDIAPGNGYIGAVAIPECDWQLKCWEWTWPGT